MSKAYLFALALTLVIAASGNAFCQKQTDQNEAYAKEVLKRALSEQNRDIKVTAVNDFASFIKVIEPVLFNIYSKENIQGERPYQLYHMGKYWLAMGTLPAGYVGGVFELVLDTEKQRIIYIMHGK